MRAGGDGVAEGPRVTPETGSSCLWGGDTRRPASYLFEAQLPHSQKEIMTEQLRCASTAPGARTLRGGGGGSSRGSCPRVTSEASPNLQMFTSLVPTQPGWRGRCHEPKSQMC